MSLPKVDLPIYELTLPSTGEVVKVRPFVVKEEKLLLQALSSKDELQIIETTKQIVNNCILSPGTINVDKLPFFDVDYLFIALRAKSVGESISVNFTCNNKPDGTNRCAFVFAADINISNVEVENLDIAKTIQLTNSIVVKMKWPAYHVMKLINDSDDQITKNVKIIAASIETIIDGNKTYSPKDYSREEFEAFVEGFTEEQFRKVKAFVDNFPNFRIVANNKCPKCGFNHRIEYTDFTSFFT